MAIKLVWKPHPGSQSLALSCPADEILYHGTRGPGKTDAQLMRFRKNVGVGYGKFWRGVIFDREYKNLDDLVAKSQRWFPEFNDGCKFLSSKSDYKWVWPTGEELLFRVVKKPKDYWMYHGQEFPFIGWNELTKYPTSNLYEAMMSCNRSSFIPEQHPVRRRDGELVYLKPIPLETFSTTNPYGPGHNWVKKYFIDKAGAGQFYTETTRVYDPRTQQEVDVKRIRCHIFGSYRENPNLDVKYIANLVNMTDANKREAWLKGNWDITAGGMFDDLWKAHIHVVKPFAIPPTWKIDRSFDWGSSKPFSVGWWARSDGSDLILPDGTRKSTVRGDLFRIYEWYGTNGKENEGLMMNDSDIAAGIIRRELESGYFDRIVPGPADNSIWDVFNDSSTAAIMEQRVNIDGRYYAGVSWERSDKSPGSRVKGWKLIREYLQGAIPKDGKREKPGLFIFDTCKYTLDLFPSLARDEDNMDDIDTEVEDHIADEMRYRVMYDKLNLGISRTRGQ